MKLIFFIIYFQFCPVDPSLECPDERVFTVYFTNVGHCLIQPKLHKNAYLHHIDQSLSVQPLDLNWRCPEEYYFHFSAVPEPYARPKSDIKVCTHQPECRETEEPQKVTEMTDTLESATQTLIKSINAELQKLDKRAEIPELKQKALFTKPLKSKNFLSDLFFGCFSVRSSKLKTTEV